MKKLTLTLTMVIVMTLSTFSQTPQAFKYQTIVRNNAGEVLNNQLVSFQVGIIRDSILYAPSYYETHTISTNEHGLVSLQIGLGTPTYGQFDTINWGSDDYHIEVGLDENGGAAYTLMGTTQLLAVPYALYSENTTNKDDNDLIRSGNYIYTISDSLGIGTSTPGAKLDVAGHIWQTNTGGSVLIGEGAGFMDDLSQKNNIAIGSYALYNNTDIGELLAIGDSALFNNGVGATGFEEGFYNMAIGSNALFSNTTGKRNLAIGMQALYSNTAGRENIAVGYRSLFSNLDGDGNTAFGLLALEDNTTGDQNTAIGQGALMNNNEGFANSAFGSGTLAWNTTGHSNTATGYWTLIQNLTGYGNTASGLYAMSSTDSGNYNCAYGSFALQNNSSGSNNTAIGSYALRYNNNGFSNVAIGDHSLHRNEDRSNLVAVGDSALFNNSIGVTLDVMATGNTALGSKVLYSNTTGWENTGVGHQALYSNVTGSFNNSLGFQSLYNNVNGSENIAFGHSAMYNNISGNSNTALGTYTMVLNTEGNYNTAVGISSLNKNLNGSFNCATGSWALRNNTTGNYNTANGHMALDFGTTGSYNCAMGAITMRNNYTGSYNTALGSFALLNNHDGNSNVAVGYGALYHSSDLNNLVAIGDSALYHNGTGASGSWDASWNTAIGSKALYDNTTGYGNTSIGFEASMKNTTGTGNTSLGYGAMQYNKTGNNNTAIGTVADLGNDFGSANVTIGSSTNLANASGSQNTIIGTSAGHGLQVHTKSGCVLIGYQAGYKEHNSNKLYIENSNADSTSALIYGEFDNDILALNASVGIGTINPSEQLHLVGNLRMVDGNEEAGNIMVSDANGTGSWINPTDISDGDWTISGDNLYTSVFGNVGIGTTNPAKQLEVSDTEDAWLRIAGDDDNSGGDNGTQNAYLQFTTDGNNEGYDGLIWLENLLSDTKLHFDVEDQEIMVFHNGRIGMGTDSPLAAVSNSPVLVTDGIKTTGPTGINWQVTDYGGYAVGIENTATGGSGLLVDAGNNSGTGATVAHFVSSNASLMYIGENGNVGINNTTPARKLHINDVMRLEPRSSAPGGASAGDLYFDGITHKLRCYDGAVWQDCW